MEPRAGVTITSARGMTFYQLGRLLSRKDPEGPYIDGDGASLEYVYDENKVIVKTKNGVGLFARSLL